MSSQSPQSTPQEPPSESAKQGALDGLNPMGLMDAVISEDDHEWQPPKPEDLELLVDGYEHFSFIDRGGMGAVYAATQKSLSRRVAIKVLAPELSDDADFVRLFEREGKMLGQLQHPQIVTVYESGRTREGHLFLVMEYVHGKTLLEHLRERRPTVIKALDYTAQVCDALIYAHGRGVMHLDIKPGNILIDERDLVRVADFGLSRGMQIAHHETTSQRSRGFLGTVGYASPEQRRKDGQVDHRSDIYSLGVTLYEMLTGLLPVGVFDLPSKKVGSAAHIDKIVLRAMREKAEDRYLTVGEMRSAIAHSMLRLGQPLVQRAIISRPMVSMVTCVMVGMGLIFLLGSISDQMNSIGLAAASAQLAESKAALTPLDENWAVIRQKTRWQSIEGILGRHPGWMLAEIHSEAEQEFISKLIRDHDIKQSLWLGASITPTETVEKVAWLSGAAMDYQAWMPAALQPPVIITEIQAKNGNTFKTADGQTPDWIEVFNPATVPADLTGYHLHHFFGGPSMGEYVLQGWATPGAVPEKMSLILQPGEYRIVGCSPRLSNASGIMHFGLSLEGSAGRVEWISPQGFTCQRFAEQWSSFTQDGSIGLSPDGKEWGWCHEPTPGKPNTALKAPFPAPTTTSPAKFRVVALPEFGSKWARCPTGIPSSILLRRVKE
ncbi:MAG: protein kinase [Prosthecobacter sp.]